MSSFPTSLTFTKMHGLGNDFMVLDATQTPINLVPEQLTLLADRHFGVGFDQRAGVIELNITNTGLVRVNMGIPKTKPSEIPFITGQEADFYKLEAGGELVKLAVVNMGNPHAVLPVASVDNAPVQRLGAVLESHSCFPSKVNVGFMQVLARDTIKLRVYERGAGETLACGTGACAAVVAGRRAGWLDEKVKVYLPGGELEIEWQGNGTPVFMEGSATTLYDGVWYGF